MNNVIFHKDSENPVKIKMLIVDDHELLRQALSNVFKDEPDITVIGEAVDGEQAVSLTAKLHPEVVIMDIEMPNLNGIEATRRIKKTFPATTILALTAFDDSEYILSILDAGASGYIMKSAIGKEIPNAIRAAINGEFILSEVVIKRLLKYASRYPIKKVVLEYGDRLTSKDIEILRLMAKGESNKAIAAELDLSLNTVKKYVMSIFDKMEVNSRTAAVINAQHAGLISSDD